MLGVDWVWQRDGFERRIAELGEIGFGCKGQIRQSLLDLMLGGALAGGLVDSNHNLWPRVWEWRGRRSEIGSVAGNAFGDAEFVDVAEK